MNYHARRDAPISVKNIQAYSCDFGNGWIKNDKKSSISHNLRLTRYDIYYRIIVNKRN